MPLISICSNTPGRHVDWRCVPREHMKRNESAYLVDRAHVAKSLPGTYTGKLRGLLLPTQPARYTTFCRAKVGNAAMQL